MKAIFPFPIRGFNIEEIFLYNPNKIGVQSMHNGPLIAIFSLLLNFNECNDHAVVIIVHKPENSIVTLLHVKDSLVYREVHHFSNCEIPFDNNNNVSFVCFVVFDVVSHHH